MSCNIIQNLKRSLILATAICGTASGAFAADLDEVLPSAGWTGFYIGGYIGAGGIVTNLEAPGLGAGNLNGLGGEGLLGGIMVGYNYQVSPTFVFGVQGDIALINLDAELSIPGIPVSASAGPEYVASISARAGYLATLDTMLYVLGGYSQANFNASFSVPGTSDSFDQKYHGFHVGTGIETKLSPNLTARLEYRYTQYSGEDWGTAGGLNIEPSSHTATFGLAWNWFDPSSGTAEPVDAASSDSDWNGFYIGGYIGAGAIITNLEAPGLGAGNLNGLGGEGILGGIMVGYNYQVSPNFVLGIQGDVALTDLDAELSIPGIPVSASAGPEYIASISARAGYLATSDTMLYVLGGYSHANFNASFSVPGTSDSFDQKYHGFHVGTGIETKLSSNLTARLEYRYTQFSGEDWGTGGGLNIEPSSHTAAFGLAWNW